MLYFLMEGLPYEFFTTHNIMYTYAMLAYKHGKISEKKTA